MSPRGLPDWNVQTGALAGSNFDVSENSARLGYPEVFNRLGRVVFWELFGDDISPWIITTSGAGAGAALDTTRYLWKPASLALTPGTDSGQFVVAVRRIPLTRSGKIGLASALYFSADDVDMRMRFEVFHTDAPSRYEVSILGTGSVRILDGDTSSFVEVADIGALGDTLLSWVFAKMVVDWENGRYQRLQVNDQTVDISTRNGLSVAFSQPPRLVAQLRVDDDSAGGDVGYFDFVAVTIDEP